MNICHLHSYTSDERMIYFCRGSDFLKLKINFLDLGAFKTIQRSVFWTVTAQVHDDNLGINCQKSPSLSHHMSRNAPACFLHHLSAGNRAAIRFSKFSHRTRIGKFSQFAFATEKFDVWGGGWPGLMLWHSVTLSRWNMTLKWCVIGPIVGNW